MEMTTFQILEPKWSLDNSTIYIECGYECDQKTFTEKFEINLDSPLTKKNDEALASLMKILAIATATSYYKAFVATQINIGFEINEGILSWSRHLFDEGLREFKYSNNIDIEQTPVITAKKILKDHRAAPNVAMIEKCLVPIGGGKDSATTLEILNRSDVDIIGFSVGDFKPIIDTASTADIELIKANRTLDKALIELNDAGAPNGHIPVTAINSSLALITALCVDADAVVMSNESSADEPTRIVDEKPINHQWSKSSDAENLLRNALSACGITINYFSMLRGLSEYEIFQLFSTFEKFHPVFTSCNRAFRISLESRAQSWCGNCDKCRFVYMGLAAFMPNSKVAKIFGSDLLSDDDQIAGFVDLLGLSDNKPFECVGTLRESRALAEKMIARNPKSPIAKALKNEKLNHSTNLPLASVIRSKNNIPIKLNTTVNNILIDQYKNKAYDTISENNFAVIGLGRETSAIIRYLDQIGYSKVLEVFLPKDLEISSSAQHELIKQNHLESINLALKFVTSIDEIVADVVLASPGISKYSYEITFLKERATTPLAWWLELNKVLLPTTGFIGITGTKGKSTTSSMLAHILENSILAGNVGNAVGDIKLENLVGADFVILEISSYQASYAKVSPHIVGVTTLFDCHIDWHLSPENYRRDKLNIAFHGAEHLVVSSEILKSYPELNAINDTKVHVIQNENYTIKQKNTALVIEIVNLASSAISDSELQQRIESFQPLKHRYETIAEQAGIKFISDVLSTAPQAVLASVQDTLLQNEGNVFLLYGGAISDVNQQQFIKDINQLDRVKVIALPQTGHQIEGDLKYREHGKNLEDGFEIARFLAKSGDVVLLAPGAPSFHAYKNYEELAAHFQELVDRTVG